MSKLFFIALSFVSFNALAESEVLFDPEAEKKCFKEVHALKCGSPDGKNQEAFMKCVDIKILKLTPGCQEMHKVISKDAHSGHKH